MTDTFKFNVSGRAKPYFESERYECMTDRSSIFHFQNFEAYVLGHLFAVVFGPTLSEFSK